MEEKETSEVSTENFSFSINTENRKEPIKTLSGGDKNNNLALLEACKCGDLETVRSILNNSKADINQSDHLLWTGLHEASIHNCQFSEITKCLLENGAYVNLQDENGDTPLHGAVLFHAIENVKLLLEYKADITIKNKIWYFPVRYHI